MNEPANSQKDQEFGRIAILCKQSRKEEFRPKCIRSLSSVVFADDVFWIVFAAKVVRPHVLCFLIPAVNKSVRSIGARSRGHRLHREELILVILVFSFWCDRLQCNLKFFILIGDQRWQLLLEIALERVFVRCLSLIHIWRCRRRLRCRSRWSPYH